MSLATKASSHLKGGIVALFYLLTFLTGGFFLLAGGRLGFVVNLTAAVSYISLTVLFYALSKGA
jgi:hypothetical protein